MQKVYTSAFILLAGFIYPWIAHGGTILRMQTDLGGVNIELYDIATPLTKDNFLFYANGGVDGNGYDGTFIHRNAKIEDSGVAVLQMGGYVFDPTLGEFTDNTGITHIPVQSAVLNEPGISNTRGTLAMAKGANPDSATSEFYINLVDNTTLDTQNGGFTVFGEVLPGGMAVIDAIAALERCKDIGYILPNPCTAFPQVPLVAIEATNGAIFTTPVLEQNIVNLWNIGIDTDNDGIIDKVENIAPNNGDMNNDAVADSTQSNIASFQTISGDYIFIEVPQGTVFQSTDVLGQTFANTTVDPFDINNALAGLTVFQGFFATEISGALNAGTISLALTVPSGDTPNAFYIYGPTPNNSTPHWYEFTYDGETGAQINNNVITLHFVDGKRGDADLQPNGNIQVPPGGPVRKPGDSDGIPDATEDNAPNNGDGNNDGVLDSEQDHVASFPDFKGTYITIEASSQMSLGAIQLSDGLNYFAQANPQDQLAGLNFSHGFLAFNALGPNTGDAVDVNIIFPKGETPVSYFMFGPTPGNPVDHLYEFTFDGETGAEFNTNVVTLHFVDGKRGDSDLATDGNISTLGAPASTAEISDGGGGGGGCTMQRSNGPHDGGAWLLFYMLATYFGFVRSYRKMQRLHGY